MKQKLGKGLAAFGVRLWNHRLSLVVVLLLVTMLIVSGALKERNLASEPGQQPIPNVTSERPSLTIMTAKVIAVLALVIALLYGGMFGLKRLYGSGVAGGLAQGSIKVLCRQQIAPRKAIYVVKVANRAMVLGVTDSQISHLSDLNEEEVSTIVSKQTGGDRFKRTLLGALGFQEKSQR